MTRRAAGSRAVADAITDPGRRNLTYPTFPQGTKTMGGSRWSSLRLTNAALGESTSLFAAGRLLEGCSTGRPASKLQMRRLLDAQKRLGGAVRRSEIMVLADYVDEALRGLTDIGPESWAALSVQEKRGIMDVVIDRVIVYPKDQPNNRWAPPHKIKVFWR